MRETQREPVPRDDGGELDTALAFLSFARSCLVKKTDGLTDEQLRRAVVPSGTSVLGLVQHMTVGERYWFGWVLGGDDGDEPGDAEWAASMSVPAGVAPAQVLADYRAAIADSDSILRAVGDPNELTARPVDDDVRKTMRWVLAHVTSETARHAGHADILREMTDGVTGR